MEQKIDNMKPEDEGVPLDLVRSFDKVSHQRLARSFGIRGTLLKWIDNCLKDGTFQARIGDSL